MKKNIVAKPLAVKTAPKFRIAVDGIAVALAETAGDARQLRDAVGRDWNARAAVERVAGRPGRSHALPVGLENYRLARTMAGVIGAAMDLGLTGREALSAVASDLEAAVSSCSS